MIIIKGKKKNGKVVRYEIEGNVQVYGIEVLHDIETRMNICPVPKRINDAQECVLRVLRNYEILGNNCDCKVEPVFGEHCIVVDLHINI